MCNSIISLKSSVYTLIPTLSRKSRNTWSNRQIWPWNTEWSRAETNRVLPRKCTGHSKHPLPTTQERLYTWTSPDGQHQNQIEYILCSQRWRSFIQSAKTRLEADCGSDHELLIAKFRLKLKKVGKPTRLFRYDLNQIPYNYTVEVTDGFRVEIWYSAWWTMKRGSWHSTWGSDQDHPHGKEMQ